MLKRFRYFLGIHLLPALVYRIIRLYSATFRLTVHNEEAWMKHHTEGGVILLCCLHQQFFAAIRYYKTYAKHHPGLMISKSKDGEVIAQVANRTGWVTVRGSSSKGGAEALKDMIAHLKEHRLAAHILDGPRGPIGIVKPGLIRLAQESKARIVPFYIQVDRAWFFKSWDRFMLPKPFSRVKLIYDDMIQLEEITSDEDFERQRLHVENLMKQRLYPLS